MSAATPPCWHKKLTDRYIKKKLRAVNKLPSTNTKTKLDLTKLIRGSPESLNYLLQM